MSLIRVPGTRSARSTEWRGVCRHVSDAQAVAREQVSVLQLAAGALSVRVEPREAGPQAQLHQAPAVVVAGSQETAALRGGGRLLARTHGPRQRVPDAVRSHLRGASAHESGARRRAGR
jgi:hypothetical protein